MELESRRRKLNTWCSLTHRSWSVWHHPDESVMASPTLTVGETVIVVENVMERLTLIETKCTLCHTWRSFNFIPPATETKSCFLDRRGFNCKITSLTVMKTSKIREGSWTGIPLPLNTHKHFQWISEIALIYLHFIFSLQAPQPDQSKNWQSLQQNICLQKHINVGFQKLSALSE